MLVDGLLYLGMEKKKLENIYIYLFFLLKIMLNAAIETKYILLITISATKNN